MPPQTKTKLRTRRTHVPRKLHSELSNYASLLRSMRINDTSDLAGELIRYGKRKRDEVNREDAGDNESRRKPRKRRHALPSFEPEPETVQPSSQKRRKPKRKDMYTLWPLFPEHCPTPDFSFEEEVAAVAEEWLRNRGQCRTQDEDESQSEDISEWNEDTPAIQCEDDLIMRRFDLLLSTSQMTSIILSSVAFLRTLLRTLAFHKVGSAAAPQSRGKPMTWVDVLEIFASDGVLGLGLKDSKIIERVQARLCEIYGDHSHSIGTINLFSSSNIQLILYDLAPQIALTILESKQTLREMDRKYQKMILEKLSIPTSSRKRFNSHTSQESAGDEEDVDNNEDESESEEWEEESEQRDKVDMDGEGTGDGSEDEDVEEKHLRSGSEKPKSTSAASASHNYSDSDSECGSDQENIRTTPKQKISYSPSRPKPISDSSSSAFKSKSDTTTGSKPVSDDSSASSSTSKFENTGQSERTKRNEYVSSSPPATLLLPTSSTSSESPSDDDSSGGEESSP